MAVWMGKALYGHFCRDFLPLVDLKWQWYWIGHAGFTKETEGFIFAAQEKALTTSMMKRNIFHLDVSPLCRLCGSTDETINHLISSCSYIAQTAYKSATMKLLSLYTGSWPSIMALRLLVSGGFTNLILFCLTLLVCSCGILRLLLMAKLLTIARI